MNCRLIVFFMGMNYIGLNMCGGRKSALPWPDNIMSENCIYKFKKIYIFFLRRSGGCPQGAKSVSRYILYERFMISMETLRWW